MIARGAGGKVITIGSLMSLLGLPYLSIYAITKGALGQLTKVLAAEWGKYNIQVNCIAPGFILTDLNRSMWQQPRMSEWLKGSQANPRLGSVEDIAPLAVFLSGRGRRLHHRPDHRRRWWLHHHFSMALRALIALVSFALLNAATAPSNSPVPWTRNSAPRSPASVPSAV